MAHLLVIPMMMLVILTMAMSTKGSNWGMSECLQMNVLHRQKKEGMGEKIISISKTSRSMSETFGNDQNSTFLGSSRLLTLDWTVGEYYATFQLGTPPVDLILIPDTGSELTWIQCEPCISCFSQEDGYPIFNPNKSSTFKYVHCDINHTCVQDNAVKTECSGHNICGYNVRYGDASSSNGYLVKDHFFISSTNESHVLKKNLVYGCGFVNYGGLTNASGILGLDQGEFSIISQLGVSEFSYCLPYRSPNNTNVFGYLNLGKSPNVVTNITYTPLLQNIHVSKYYYHVKMLGISVNGQILDVPSMAFELSDSGDGGTIVDSGTTLTSFVDEVYGKLYIAFSNAMDPSLIEVNIEGYGVCYKSLLAKKAPKVPKITLHLDGPLNIELDEHHVIYYLGRDKTHNYYCLAFDNATTNGGDKNIIGNFQQQNFHVEYDILNSRIGFAPLDCNNPTTASYNHHKNSSYSPFVSSPNTSNSSYPYSPSPSPIPSYRGLPMSSSCPLNVGTMYVIGLIFFVWIMLT